MAAALSSRLRSSLSSTRCLLLLLALFGGCFLALLHLLGPRRKYVRDPRADAAFRAAVSSSRNSQPTLAAASFCAQYP